MIFKKKEFILAFYAFLGVSTSFATEELKNNFSPSLQGKNLKEREAFKPIQHLKMTSEGYKITPSGLVLIPGKAISLQLSEFLKNNPQRQGSASQENDNLKKRSFSIMITGGQKSNFGGKKVINLNNLLVQN